jgi:hypothetical protein
MWWRNSRVSPLYSPKIADKASSRKFGEVEDMKKPGLLKPRLARCNTSVLRVQEEKDIRSWV